MGALRQAMSSGESLLLSARDDCRLRASRPGVDCRCDAKAEGGVRRQPAPQAVVEKVVAAAVVASRRPSRPEPIVVKCGRQRSLLRQAKTRCVVCGAELRGDHDLGDLVCDVHPRDGFNPRHDAHLEEHILVLLWRARGAPVNLYRALGCESTWNNRQAIHAAVCSLRCSGAVRVRGRNGVGYELVTSARWRSGKLGA